MYYETDYLAHYGVLGMKWGVRKAEKYERRAGEYEHAAKEKLLTHSDVIFIERCLKPIKP